MDARLVGEIGSRKSLGDLLNDLTDGGAQLVREEVRLARAETIESLLTLRRGAVLLATGLAIAICSAAAAVASLIMVISRYLLDDRTWLAALLAAVVLGVAGWICVWKGRRSLSASRLSPHETAMSIKETTEWLKHPARSLAR